MIIKMILVLAGAYIGLLLGTLMRATSIDSEQRRRAEIRRWQQES